jgi:hypothetical protein
MTRSARPQRRLVLGLLALLSACAVQSNLIQVDVGRASRYDVLNKIETILTREGYTVQERRDSGSLIQLGTSWTTRQPFEDEAARGVTEARTRVSIEARRQGNETFSVVLRAENSVLTDSGDGVWKALPPTTMFREHVRELSTALALEVDSGVRTR